MGVPEHLQYLLTHPAAQQPEWPDWDKLMRVVNQLSNRAPLVSPEEVWVFQERLAAVAAGKAFMFWGGDCQEPLWEPPELIELRLRLFLSANLVLLHAGSTPIVKAGRIAGQYAKPRSEEFQTRRGRTHPVYRGPNINQPAFNARARRPKPGLLVEGYNSAVAVANYVRALMTGGFADLHNAQLWLAGMVNDPQYETVLDQTKRALAFITAARVNPSSQQALRAAEFHFTHEGLIPQYEVPMIRWDPIKKKWVNLSAHMIWIGDRTKQLDGAQVRMCTEFAGPVGVKVGPTTTLEELEALLNVLDPDKDPGRIVLIIRMGVELIREKLRPILRLLKRLGRNPVVALDPMHGNGKKVDGVKTRFVEDIIGEIDGYFDVCLDEKYWPGGIHLEMTGEPDVTECLGGSSPVTVAMLRKNYVSLVDPRLNQLQTLNVVFHTAERLDQARQEADKWALAA